MNVIYQVTVRGQRLESRDLRKLLARAVAEKRIMDQRLRISGVLHTGSLAGSCPLPDGLRSGEAATG